MRSNSRICAFSIRSWAPRAATQVRATSGSRMSTASATTPSSCSTPLRPTGATMPNSARCARIALITAVCWRMKQMARTVEHQAALLLGRLGRDEPHVRPADCLADRLCIGGIILLPLDVGLHVGRRHQPNGVAKRLQLARPMVRRGTGFDANQAWRQLLEECQHVPTLQLAAEDHLPSASTP